MSKLVGVRRWVLLPYALWLAAIHNVMLKVRYESDWCVCVFVVILVRGRRFNLLQVSVDA
jgi:hypothetical protein